MLLLGRIVAALLSGALLAQSLGLNPFWPLAWIAPIPLLIAAMGASRVGAFAYGALAGAVSMALMLSYFMELGGPASVAIITLSRALMWGGFALAVRSAAKHLPDWAGVFVFPALFAGVETLIAAVSPHGSAGAIAYSQMDFVYLIQVAALGGAPAITFVLALLASMIAYLVVKRAFVAALMPLALVGGALAFGLWRVPPTMSGERVNAMLLAGDQFAGVPADWQAVWAGYTPLIERAADQDFRIVLLPEKIARFDPDERGAAIVRLEEIARRRDLLLVVGVDDDTGEGRFNRAFAFGANETESYDKRHMIPGFESHFAIGQRDLTVERDGIQFGVAICKDMDFPNLARRYAGVTAMLVPAWDFGRDAWLHSRMAMLRGVENGYAIVRSARDGALTVSDAYGQVTAEAPSGPLTAYNVAIPREAPGPTLYARFGDVFGWAMLALAIGLIGWSFWRRRRLGQGG